MKPAKAQEITRPASVGFIVITLAIAMVLNVLPWSGVLIWLKPDFVALILLYWCVHAPRSVGFFSAFVLGLLMDVAMGRLLGEHALAYTVLAYLGVTLFRRVQMFGLGFQMLQVAPILLAPAIVILCLRLFSGAEFPGIQFFAGALVGAALWPLLRNLLRAPGRPKHEL
ncbi:MAG: rod shape-determining protein MreD [Burkholderiales bacterium]